MLLTRLPLVALLCCNARKMLTCTITMNNGKMTRLKSKGLSHR